MLWPIGTKREFREGALVEALNPKTAAFFLAYWRAAGRLQQAAGRT